MTVTRPNFGTASISKTEPFTSEPLSALADIPGYKDSIWELSTIHRKISSDFVVSVNQTIARREDLLGLRKKNLRAIADYNQFKRQNKLQVDPQYEQSSIFAVGILGISTAIETAFNSQLFRQVSDTTNEAIILAFLVSVLNVGFGFMTGKLPLSKLAKPGRGQRFVWGFTSALLCVFAVAFNAMLGLLRQQMEKNGGDNVLTAIQNLMRVLQEAFGAASKSGSIGLPGGLELNSQSFFLSLVGVLIFAVACYKGFTMEGAYPEYADRHRSMIASEERFINEKVNIEAAYEEDLSELRSALTTASSAHDVRTQSPAEMQLLLDWSSQLLRRTFDDAEMQAIASFRTDKGHGSDAADEIVDATL